MSKAAPTSQSNSSPNVAPFSWKLLIQPTILGTLLVSFILDQWTKNIVINTIPIGRSVEVTSFLNWVHTKNRGAAFGMFHEASETFRIFLFGGMTLLCLVFLGYWLGTTPLNQRCQRWGLSLIMGGALGNVYDRVVHGHVTDFIDFHAAGWHFWAFNIADSCITVGVSLMFIAMLLERREKSST